MSKQIRMIAGVSVLFITACASPKVHEEVDAMDHRLSCSQMEHEIREMEKHRMKVAESKGLTFRNMLTTTVFFPITMATYSNVDDAQTASRNRQKHLMDLYSMKGCNTEGSQTVRLRERVEPVAHRYSEVVESDDKPDSRSRSRYSDAHLYSAQYLFQDN